MSINQTLNNEGAVLSTIGKNLYLSDETADIHFIFESGDDRVPAHKVILSGGSDVFKTMFYGSLKEEADIKIVNSTAKSFKEFLRFFYFNKLDVSMERVSDVMYLGKKYNVPECVRLCAELLEASITDQNVITTLDLAIFCEQFRLQKSCESFIAFNLYEVLESENFLVCNRRVLEHIIKLDYLACSKTKMFEACMSWVRTTNNEDLLTRDIVMKHLGGLFYEIPSTAMTSDEFSKLLPVYGELFTGNEYSEILQVISGQNKNPKIFKSCRRLPSWDSGTLILCDRMVNSTPKYLNYIQTEEVTKFSTDSWLLLGCFVIAPKLRVSGKIQNIEDVNITVTDNSTEVLEQVSFSSTLNYADVDKGYKVDLPKPIVIRSGTIYEIRIMFPTNVLFWGFNSKTKVSMKEGINVNFYNDESGVITSLGFNLLTA